MPSTFRLSNLPTGTWTANVYAAADLSTPTDEDVELTQDAAGHVTGSVSRVGLHMVRPFRNGGATRFADTWAMLFDGATVDCDESRALVGGVTLTTTERTTLVAAVWNALTSGMSTVGSIGVLLKQLTFTTENKVDATATIDGSAAISVVVPSAVAVASAEVNLITAVRGDTLRRIFNNLGDLTDRSALWLTVKRSYDDSDADAIIQITEAGGLLTFQGAPAADASLGSLTVATEEDASVTFFLHAANVALLAPVGSGLVFDAQWRNGSTGDVTTILSGEFIVPADVTRATS